MRVWLKWITLAALVLALDPDWNPWIALRSPCTTCSISPPCGHGCTGLEKISEKEHAFKHVMNRVYGYMTPPARAEYQEWVERKGLKQKEKIVLP